jgi:hypothetical protein
MANYAPQSQLPPTLSLWAGKLKGIFVSAASSTPTITVYDSAAATTTQDCAELCSPLAAATSYVFPR